MYIMSNGSESNMQIHYKVHLSTLFPERNATIHAAFLLKKSVLYTARNHQPTETNCQAHQNFWPKQEWSQMMWNAWINVWWGVWVVCHRNVSSRSTESNTTAIRKIRKWRLPVFPLLLLVCQQETQIGGKWALTLRIIGLLVHPFVTLHFAHMTCMVKNFPGHGLD